MTHQSVIRLRSLPLFVLFMLILFSNQLNARNRTNDLTKQTTTLPGIPDKPDKSTLWSADHFGEIYLSGGTGQHFNFPSFMGFKGVLDYQLSKRLALGAQAALIYGTPQFNSARTPMAGLRLSYHFVRPGSYRSRKNWDVYLGTSGDLYVGAGNKPSGEKEILADLFSGLRYRLNRYWFLWSELSVRSFNVGLSLQI